MDARLSRAESEGLDDFGRLQALHEAALAHVFAGRIEDLNEGMRALTSLFVVVGDIDNGGFAALMYNSSGGWILEAVAGARLIGASEHADLLEEFVRLTALGDALRNDELRGARLEAMNETEESELEELDEAFYALDPIDALLTRYVDAHPQEFFRD